MTALTRAPYNKDLLQSTKFRVTFDRLPGTTYFCQTANFPGVSLTEIPRQTPFVDLYVPGEKIVYDTFNITFLVDEDLRAWTDIHDWIRATTFPTDFKEYLDLRRLDRAANFRANFQHRFQRFYFHLKILQRILSQQMQRLDSLTTITKESRY